MPLKLIELYVHSSKEDSFDACHKAGFTGEALAKARHIGTEHKMHYVVSTETGQATLIAVDGCPVGEIQDFFVTTDMNGNVVDFAQPILPIRQARVQEVAVGPRRYTAAKVQPEEQQPASKNPSLSDPAQNPSR